MVSLQQYPNGIFHVHFRFVGERFKRSLKTRAVGEANGRVARRGETIRLVEMGRLEIPDEEDVATFLLADGKPITAKRRSDVRTLSPLFLAYDAPLPPGAKEESTLKGASGDDFFQSLVKHLAGARSAVCVCGGVCGLVDQGSSAGVVVGRQSTRKRRI